MSPFAVKVALFLLISILRQNQAFVPSQTLFSRQNKILRTTETRRTTASWQRCSVSQHQQHPKARKTTQLCGSLFPSQSQRNRSYEELLQELPSQPVVQAVTNNNNGNNNKVVAADVAAAAGVSLSQARRDLTALASISQGDIQVDANGELIYVFPNDLSSTLKQNSRKYQLQQLWRDKIGPAAFWLVRVGFGVALLASAVAIFATIFFIQTSSGSSSDDRDNGGFGGDGERRGGGMGMGGGWSYWWGPTPFDFLYWGRPYGYYGRPVDQRYTEPQEEMGFLESVFSYIFGDGNPNSDVNQRQLALASRMIRENRGAVTAEQLAPFCLEEPPKKNDSVDEFAGGYVDESFVLPIVTALGGEPRVTDEGDIIYVFEELQTTVQEDSFSISNALSVSRAKEAQTLQRAGLKTTATNRDIRRFLEYNRIGVPRGGAVERSDLIRILEQVLPPLSKAEQQELQLMSDPSVLIEREYQFSLASDINKLLAGGLGVVNLGGALYLGNLFAQMSAAGFTGTLPGWYGAVQTLYPGLLGYAVLFNIIPAVRNLWIQQQNQQIRARNEARKNWKAALVGAFQRNASPTLRKKLMAARKFATRAQQAGQDGVVFDTAQTSMEVMQEQKNQQDLEAFDNLLKTKKESLTEANDGDGTNQKKDAPDNEILQ